MQFLSSNFVCSYYVWHSYTDSVNSAAVVIDWCGDSLVQSNRNSAPFVNTLANAQESVVNAGCNSSAWLAYFVVAAKLSLGFASHFTNSFQQRLQSASKVVFVGGAALCSTQFGHLVESYWCYKNNRGWREPCGDHLGIGVQFIAWCTNAWIKSRQISVIQPSNYLVL